MKTIYNILKIQLKCALIVLLLISCKETPNSAESENIKNIIKEVTGQNVDINEKYALLLQELSTKTPLTNEQLMESFPKKIGNLNLDESNTKTQLVFGNFGDNSVRLEILDAVGEKAIEAVMTLKMLDLNTVTSENNNTIRYSKKERSGILTFGTDRDESVGADYESDIRFLYDNRFYVTLEGKKMDVDKLWNSMQLTDLKQFKEFNN